MKAEVFVARQPILDRHGITVAQELLFRETGKDTAHVQDDYAATAAVVERTVGVFGIEHVLGHSDGFINCTGDFLHFGSVDVLPPARFVLEILEGTALTAELGERCDELRLAGFRIALDHVRSITSHIERFLPHVDIVKLDWPGIAADERGLLVEDFRQHGKRVLAQKVEDRTDHAAAMLAGCDLFQGFYFARPQLLTTSRTPSRFAAVFRVLELLREDAGNGPLEEALKHAPALVIQLLRLANNASQRHLRHTPITSIGQAVAAVGSKTLMLWCCLLLYGNPADLQFGRNPLAQLVEQRANFMERAAAELAPEDGGFQETAWLCGLLSLAYVPCGVTAEVFFADMSIDAVIQQAILEHEGVLGTLLAIAEHLEQGRFDASLKQAGALGAEFAAKLPGLVL
ncbi:MAG: EAL domain-containing protein [Paraburkholderia sp.]|jgi:EAL and modified HD-GYP domain-containing signal transduction protein|uniref:EAL and HDOD domain-containing protein n=1 Tax=Burkholderiaceae TaxID=119060 RepID=UPI0010F9D0CA|nr:EAL domain-containing protein [Burkholderia sp. 4M9327F10]